MDKILKFLYTTFPGRVILKGLTAKPVSRACGTFLDSHFSKPLIKPFVEKNDIDLSICEREKTCTDSYDYIDGYSCSRYSDYKLSGTKCVKEIKTKDEQPAEADKTTYNCNKYGSDYKINFTISIFLFSLCPPILYLSPFLPLCKIISIASQWSST